MNPLRQAWLLDPAVHFLNHGSFGACPRPVLEHQQRLRDQLERQPVAFMQRELPIHLEEVRAVLGGFVGADPADLVFVTNATSGVNAVLRSLSFEPGDEILITDHAYPACRRTVEYVASRSGARIRVVEIPLQPAGSHIVDRILDAAGPATRLALIDHVASPTSLVFPIDEIVASLAARNVDTLVDGAHAPGMLPLQLEDLGAAYYTGNCHKWMCAPKGAAFLYVRPDRQGSIVPTVISHGYRPDDPSGAAFHEMFDWAGTADPTAVLSIGVAIDTVASLDPGGWPAVMHANRELAAAGAEIVATAVDSPAQTPLGMRAAMVSFELPAGYPPGAGWDPLQDRLLFEHRVEVPIVPWPRPPHRLLRISAHIYNELDEFRALAEALRAVL